MESEEDSFGTPEDKIQDEYQNSESESDIPSETDSPQSTSSMIVHDENILEDNPDQGTSNFLENDHNDLFAPQSSESNDELRWPPFANETEDFFTAFTDKPKNKKLAATIESTSAQSTPDELKKLRAVSQEDQKKAQEELANSNKELILENLHSILDKLHKNQTDTVTDEENKAYKLVTTAKPQLDRYSRQPTENVRETIKYVESLIINP